jgi:hypothetical protein
MHDRIVGIVAERRIALHAIRPVASSSSSGTFMLRVRFIDPTTGFAAEREIPCSPIQYYRYSMGAGITLRRVGWSGTVEWVIEE